MGKSYSFIRVNQRKQLSNKFLVIPSIRENSLKDFLTAWKNVGDWDKIILIEDNPTKTFHADVDHHYSWREIEEALKDNAWIISKKDSAIRSFGFWLAYTWGADYTLTLDDDCFPYSKEPIFETHIEKITTTPVWTESIIGMRTRGLPYLNKGTLTNVVANMGLWTKVPDLDSIQSLTNPIVNFIPPNNVDRIIPQGQYFPLCGMNFCFSRAVAPLTYLPLMGQGSPYHRFDDIWFGITFKKIIDHLGLLVSVGHPFVEHQRASDVMTNLVKEAPGISTNEHFWQIIQNITLSGSTPVDCLIEVGNALQCPSASGISDKYFYKLGQALVVWANLFK